MPSTDMLLPKDIYRKDGSYPFWYHAPRHHIFTQTRSVRENITKIQERTDYSNFTLSGDIFHGL